MVERMTVADYKEIYEKILDLSFDAEGFGLFKHITDEDAEKCLWIAAILETLKDVPLSRMEHIFRQRSMTYDSKKFWGENFEANSMAR